MALISKWIILRPFTSFKRISLLVPMAENTEQITRLITEVQKKKLAHNGCQGSVSRKSRQTGTVCKWLGNMVHCHQKQMKSRIWLKEWVFAQANLSKIKKQCMLAASWPWLKRGDSPALVLIILNLNTIKWCWVEIRLNQGKTLPTLTVLVISQTKILRFSLNQIFLT